MKAPRLRTQLAIGNAVTVFALVCVVTVLLTSRSDDLRRAQAERDAQRDATVLATQVESRVHNLAELRSLVSRDGTREDEIVGPTGARLVGANLMGNPAVARAASEALDDSTLASNRPTKSTDRLAVGADPVVVGGALRGATLVIEPLPPRRGWRAMYGLDIPAALALALLASFMGWWLAGRVSRPLDRLAEQARALVLNGSAEPVPPSAIPEVATLRAAMGRLADRVAQDADRRTRLDAHLRRVAHELRTPLTTIRLRVEESMAERGDPETSAVILGQLDRLERLGTDLEGLRLDQAESEPVDLAELVTQTADRLRPLAEWAHVDLRVARSGPAVVDGEADALADVVVNVVENAVKYTPSGGRVSVAVRTHDDAVVLEVADTGPGIAVELVDVMVRPGVRATGSHAVPGSGQGLAIVAATIDRHGGTLELSSTPTGGALIRILLPLRPAPSPPSGDGGGEQISEMAANTATETRQHS